MPQDPQVTPDSAATTSPPPADPVPVTPPSDPDLLDQVHHAALSAKASATNAVHSITDPLQEESRGERIKDALNPVARGKDLLATDAGIANDAISHIVNPLARTKAKIESALTGKSVPADTLTDIPSDSLFGKPTGPVDAFVRETAQFGAEAEMLGGVSEASGVAAKLGGVAATVGEAVPKLAKSADFVAKHALSTISNDVLFTLNEDDKKQAMVKMSKLQQDAPNMPMRRFVGQALQGHDHPDVIDEVARLGHNFLPAVELEGGMIMAHVGASAFRKYSSEAFDAAINKIKTFTEDSDLWSAENMGDGTVKIGPKLKVSEPKDFKVADKEASPREPEPLKVPSFIRSKAQIDAANERVAQAKSDRLAGREMFRASAEPGTTRAEPLTGPGATQAQTPNAAPDRPVPNPGTMAPDMKIGLGEKPPAEPSKGFQGPAAGRGLEGPINPEEHETRSDTLGLGSPLDRTVTLPKSSAPIEQAQREQYVHNQGVLEAGTSAHEEGWKEMATLVRAGGSAAITDKVAAHHGLHVPVGGSRLQTHDFIRELGEHVASVEHPDMVHVLGTARSVVKEWTDNTPFVKVMQHFQQVFGEKNVAHLIVATHMALRVAADKAALTAHAVAMAPDSPAARDMLQRTYATMSHLAELIRGVPVPEGEVAPVSTSEGTTAPEVSPEEATRAARTAADQIPSVPLPDVVADHFAQDLRIADGSPAMAVQAAMDARAEAGIEGVPMEDASRVPPPPPAATPGEAEGPAPISDWQRAANSFKLYRISNMISGLGTYAKVAMTQGFNLAKQPVNGLTGGLGLMIEGKTVAGRSLMTEAWHLPAGYIDQFREARGAFARAFRNGTSVADPRGQTLFPTPTWNDRLNLGPLNFMSDLPGRLHTSMADFSKVLQYRSMTRSNTIREMASRGESPENTANAVEQRLHRAFNYRPNPESLKNTGPITWDPTEIRGDLEQRSDAALDLARRSTLTQPLDGFLMGRQVREALNHTPAIKQIAAPFLTISTNDVAEKYAMVPGLAAAKASVKADLSSQDFDRRGRAIGNQILGAALISGGFAATIYSQRHGGPNANQGKGAVSMTGMPPANTAARKQAEKLGAKWNQLRIGNVTIPLDRVPQAGFEMELGGIVASAYDNYLNRENERAETWKASGGNKWCYMGDNPVSAWMRHVTDTAACTRGSSLQDAAHLQGALALETSRLVLHDSWLSGVTSILDILDSGTGDETERQAGKWAADQVATMNPMNAFWASVNTDPQKREVRTMIDRFAQNLPGYSRSLETDYNAFGEPALNDPGFMEDLQFNTQNPGRMSSLDEANREQVIAWNTALPSVRKTAPGVNGQSDIDLTDRSFDERPNPEPQSPWSYANELLNSPKWGDGGNRTAAQAVNDLMNSREFKALPWGDPLQPRGPRYTQVSQLMLEMTQDAEKEALADPRYEGVAHAMDVTKATVKNNKYLSRRAADSAAAAMDSASGNAP